jgi:hypothetical protein
MKSPIAKAAIKKHLPAKAESPLSQASAIAALDAQLEEASLPEDRTTDPTAFMQQLARLDVGQTASKAIRLPADSTTHPMILEAKAKSRNVLKGQVGKVKAKADCADRTFTMSIGHFNADNGDTLVCATVTRLA